MSTWDQTPSPVTPDAPLIAIVEDDPAQRFELARLLERLGYRSLALRDFDVAGLVAAIGEAACDLVILDLGLPLRDGVEVAAALRRHSAVPILVLTARDTARDEIEALSRGADDFLTKPVLPDRLEARLEALLRRSRATGQLLDAGRFRFDRVSGTVHAGSAHATLTRNEAIVLERLLVARNRLVTKDELARALWGGGDYIDDNALQVNVGRLRRALEDVGIADAIRTVRGRGYLLEAEDEP